jgi:hypothetical protein
MGKHRGLSEKGISMFQSCRGAASIWAVTINFRAVVVRAKDGFNNIAGDCSKSH